MCLKYRPISSFYEPVCCLSSPVRQIYILHKEREVVLRTITIKTLLTQREYVKINTYFALAYLMGMLKN